MFQLFTSDILTLSNLSIIFWFKAGFRNEGWAGLDSGVPGKPTCATTLGCVPPLLLLFLLSSPFPQLPPFFTSAVVLSAFLYPMISIITSSIICLYLTHVVCGLPTSLFIKGPAVASHTVLTLKPILGLPDPWDHLSPETRSTSA